MGDNSHDDDDVFVSMDDDIFLSFFSLTIQDITYTTNKMITYLSEDFVLFFVVGNRKKNYFKMPSSGREIKKKNSKINLIKPAID